MALTKTTPLNPANADAAVAAVAAAAGVKPGAFEADTDDVAVATAAPASAPAAAPAASPAPAPAAAAAASNVADEVVDAVPTEAQKKAADELISKSRAISTAPANALLASALKKNTVLDDLQNVISPDMLESMSFGAFPRLTVDLGGFNENKTKVLGSKIKIEVLSWNSVVLVTAGEKDNKEADKLIRTSYDGVNLLNGEGLVVDYIKRLKADGYNNAGSKKYIEIYCNLLWSEKGGAVPPEDQKICQLSVSPQSTGPWGAHLLGARMKQNRGIEIGAELVLEAGRKTLGNNTFGVIDFGGKL